MEGQPRPVGGAIPELVGFCLFVCFCFLKIYFMYMSTLSLTAPEEGIGPQLQMVVSHHVVAGK